MNAKPNTPPLPKKNGLVKNLSVNGLASLISKESLILVPEGGDTVPNGNAVENPETSESVVDNNNENADQQVSTRSSVI